MRTDVFRHNWRSLLLVPLLALPLALFGCEGDDGDDGPRGPAGPSAAEVVNVNSEVPEELNAEITDVTINSPPVVDFTVTDGSGRGVVGLTTSEVRFIIAKLTPGTDANGNTPTWQSYVNRVETVEAGEDFASDVSVGNQAVQATAERNGTLEDHGDGTYTYTFATDVEDVTNPLTGEAIPFEPSLTHRVAIQIEVEDEETAAVANPTFDFVPAGGDVTQTHNVVQTEDCNECHNVLAIHGGGRVEVDYCVTCHNPGSTDAHSGNTVDFANMVHKIHMGADLPSVELGPDGITDTGDEEPYIIWGFRNSAHDYSHVGYPQDLENCRKCHSAEDAVDGGNWMQNPSINACGACHDDVDFSTHAGGQTNSSACAGCHVGDTAVAPITEAHVTPNSTPHNPELLEGQREIAYELIDVTVDAGTGQPTVDFQITSDGTALDLTALPADLAGPGRFPVFLMAWTLPQNDTTDPADFNTLATSDPPDAAEPGSQPISVDLGDLVAGTAGSMTCSGGICTAVLNDAYPAEATHRTIGLQGYFQQDIAGNIVSLHTPSVVMAAAGDDARRDVVDSAKCSSCHEWFEAHGGNRVIGFDGGVAICTICHVPNLSSSGRTLDINHPEASNNFKDMIHGIHAADEREMPLDFVRAFRGSARFFTFAGESNIDNYTGPNPEPHVVTFPGRIADCETCHIEGTYELPLPSGLLLTTNRTTGVVGGMDATTGDVTTARSTVPNPTDWVITPVTAACYSCHDSADAAAHMEQNGGAINWDRSEVLTEDPLETCTLCHGEGRVADVEEAHGTE